MISTDDHSGPGAPYWYRAHGLNLQSDLAMPELIAAPAAERADLKIYVDESATRAMAAAVVTSGRAYNDSGERGRSGDTWPNDMDLLMVPSGGAVFQVADVATFWVPNGDEIRVAPAPGADPKDLTLFTLGSAIGLALLQRRALVLHGAGVVIDGGAVLFLGPSGAGKSTLAARLARAGIPALGDDTVALWPVGGAEGFVAYPAINAFKLWKDALEAAQISHGDLCSVANRVEKFYLPNPHTAADRPHAVTQIFLLERCVDALPASVEQVGLLEAVQGLAANVYRPCFVEALDLATSQFRQLCELADRVPVARLHRPWSHAGSDSVLALLGLDVDRTGGTRTA